MDDKHGVPYPPSYPAGVFVVSAAQHLGPLVSRLRSDRRLKAGRNVTVFDAQHFAEVITPPFFASDNNNNGDQSIVKASLARLRVRLHELTPQEAQSQCSSSPASTPGATFCEDLEVTTLRDSEAAQLLFSLLQVPIASRCQAAAAVAASPADAAHAWPTYMAVHVNGEVTDAELLSLLAPSTVNFDAAATPPPVAYIRGVRRYHRVCSPSLSELPSALAQMRRAALLQRCGGTPSCNECGSVNKKTSLEGECGVDHLPLSRTERRVGELHDLAHPSHNSSGDGFTFSELFGGIGMFRAALERLGGRATFAVEFAPPAQIVYALNHACWHDCPPILQLPNLARDAAGETASAATEQHVRHAASHLSGTHGAQSPLTPPLLVGDITEIPSCFFPHHDVLTGGFPCQSFAKAGAAAGLNAEKGWLFYEVTRALAAAQPLAFLLENVEHLVELEAGAQLHEILHRLRHPMTTSTLSDVGDPSKTAGDNYNQREEVVGDSLEYDVRHVVVDGGTLTPQTRRRVYFFGVRVASSSSQERGNTQGELLPGEIKGKRSSATVGDWIVSDAMQRLAKAAQSKPYTCVADLLVAPSVANVRENKEMSTVDETQKKYAELQLTPAQWEAVQRSHTFRQNPLWRLCDLTGKARTLLGSYRTSYQLYSEFVPYAPRSTLDEVHAALMGAGRGDPRDAVKQCREEDGKTEGDATAAPPLRFFSIRECARLQGIDDGFCFPHDEGLCTVAAVTGEGAAAPSAALLRQVPPGAVYKLIGNAVNPCVVECLSGALVAYVRKHRVS